MARCHNHMLINDKSSSNNWSSQLHRTTTPPILTQDCFTMSACYLSLFMRTASIEVRKFNSLRAAPVVVLNKQRRRGDKEGCISQNNTRYSIREKGQCQLFTFTQSRILA